MLTCLTPWTHNYGWPQKGQQTCTLCGRQRKSKLEIVVTPRFDIPRSVLKAHLKEACSATKLRVIGGKK